MPVSTSAPAHSQSMLNQAFRRRLRPKLSIYNPRRKNHHSEIRGRVKARGGHDVRRRRTRLMRMVVVGRFDQGRRRHDDGST